jgi:type I site-specific restriction-modification system R (restriction) subunit
MRKAQATRDEPWPERIRGKRRAIQSVEQEIAEHIRTNLRTLIAEVEENAVAAAAAVDEAAQTLIDRYMEREQVGQQLTALVVASGRPMHPGLTPASCADQVARAAQELLRRGEAAPVLTIDPLTNERTAPVVAIGESA